jgi:DNA-binding transcriptional MocR family regulator
LIESFAWRALTDNGHKMMNRILIEHMNHGRILNGALPVTYADFVDYGIRRNSVLPTIAECEALGLIERIRGQRARAQFKGSPQRFRICWLPTADGEPAKFAWRRFTNLAEAAKTVADARKCSVDGRSCGRRRTRHTPFKGEMEI